jgi:hypothetical protein
MDSGIPEGLGDRGSWLWEQLTTDGVWDASGLVLIMEACRLADRLEQMDRLLRGDIDTWTRVEIRDGELALKVDAVVGEARLHAGALARILAQLRLGAGAEAKQPEGSRLDELSAARARRGAATSDPGGATRL